MLTKDTVILKLFKHLKIVSTSNFGFRAFHSDNLGEWYEKVCKLSGKDKALPMNTGAEAVETALKAARRWAYDVKGLEPDKAEIIAFNGNFHGRTMAPVSLSSEMKVPTWLWSVIRWFPQSRFR